MFSHVIKVYRNCGLKPAIKAFLHDMKAGTLKRKQRIFYQCSSFSAKQRENTVVLGYRIVKTDSVRLHMDMMCELEKIIKEKNPAVIYTDELRCGELLYKPDFAPDNLDSHNYIGNCIVVKENLIDEQAQKLADASSLWEFNKYICRKCKDDEIAHVSRALFEDDKKADDGGIKALESDALHGSQNADMVNKPLVSVIIPNCEHVVDLRQCVESLIYRDDYKNIEIIIVENNSKSDEIFAYYDELIREHQDIVKVVKWDGIFNYSAINNYGAGFAGGELLLLLNNDTKLIAPDSIRFMVQYAVRDNTGAVGACLLYGDKTIQHAGVIVGIGPDRTAVHQNSGVPFIEDGYRDSIHHVQNYLAVTGACLMIKKSLFDRINGLDEKFAVAYNDVDMCLRLRTMGMLNVYVPQALFFHYESRSRGYDNKGERHERFLRESEMFRERWQHIIEDGDPYYNIMLSKDVPWKVDIVMKGGMNNGV